MPSYAEITPGKTYKRERFEGRTTLLDGGLPKHGTLFEECEFIGPGRVAGKGGSYSVFTPAEARPFSRFVRCHFRNADKALLQYCYLEECTFEDQADGVFAQAQGYLHIERCVFQKLGGLIGDHADGVQMGMGRGVLVRGCKFIADEDHPLNSGVFLESAFGKVSHVRVVGNEFHGSFAMQYGVWLWDDKHGGPRAWVDQNAFHGLLGRIPIVGNFEGWELMVGSNNRVLDSPPRA